MQYALLEVARCTGFQVQAAVVTEEAKPSSPNVCAVAKSWGDPKRGKDSLDAQFSLISTAQLQISQ